MRIGVLETGAPPKSLRPAYGTYPEMFQALLGDSYAYETFDVRGSLPAPESCDGFVITGSAAGVYEDLHWISPAMDWLRAARGRTKLVGVCFGHQLMAQAFGGEVTKSPKGWGVGLNRYDVVRPTPWTGGASSFAIPASHQDQVIAIPPDAEVVAASEFTPVAMLSWTDQPAISMQGHPEFTPAYATALIESRREEKLTDAEASRAVESLKQPDDRARVAGWIRAFLDG
jgi:GMP synthase-like glutamine amidotransferase